MATDKDTQTATREAAARTQSVLEEVKRSNEAATRRAADAARSIAEDSTGVAAQATAKIGQRAVEASRRVVEESAEASRKATEAGAELTRKSADAARDLMGTATSVTSRGTEQVQRALGLSKEAQGEVLSQARQNMDVMVQCGSVLTDGFQTIWREWVGLAQEVAARNASGVNALMRSRSLPDFYATQSSMLKDNVELVLSRSVKLSELSARTANDAVRKLADRAEDAAQETRRRF